MDLKIGQKVVQYQYRDNELIGVRLLRFISINDGVFRFEVLHAHELDAMDKFVNIASNILPVHEWKVAPGVFRKNVIKYA